MRKIAAQYIFPLNGKPPIQRGAVTLDNRGTVVEISQLSQETANTEFYNGIIVPGFVNTHCHIELSYLKGKFERASGMAGFIRQINRLRESSSREQRIELIEEEMTKMYLSGVSAMADISNGDESFAVKAKSPMYTRTFLEIFGTDPKDIRKITSGLKKLNRKALGYGIAASPTPHSCYTMSPELLKKVSSQALKAGWLSYHNQESWEEEELIRRGEGPIANEYKGRGEGTPPVTGTSALTYLLDSLKSLGLNRYDQNIMLVHNACTDEDSIRTAMGLFDNLFWAICPLSNLFIHNTVPPVELLRRLRANITIGTDSLSSNDALSIVEEIKSIHRYFPDIPLEEILEWSSYNGAKFLKIEQSAGSIEVGKRPGIVLIDHIDFDRLKLTKASSSVRIV